MKTTIYCTFAIALLLVASCKSIEKLVDQGRYDEAIELATKKLAGKKKKKTKHIKALEEAFVKVNERDIEHIAFLRSNAQGATWELVYDYARQIQLRQSRIAPFLPLISKEGYVGDFELIDVYPLLSEAGNKASEYLYDDGADLLAAAKSNGDKLLAQRAYNRFRKIERYIDKYRDVDQLLSESNALGIFHVLIKWDNTYIGYNRPVGISPSDIDRRWVRHHFEYIEGISFDAVSTLYLDDIDISPERELVNNLKERKEIERFVDALDRDGNIVVDSLDQVIQIREVEKITARITEIFRTKDALFRGHVETLDYVTGSIIDRELFNHEIHFTSDACTFRGDRRALSDRMRKRVDLNLLPFPTDQEMINEGIGQLQNNFFRHIRDINLTKYYDNTMVSR